MVSKCTFIQTSLYPWLTEQYMFPCVVKKKVCFLKFKAKKKGGGVNYFCHPQLFKVGRVIVPSSFSHEVVLVKFELQTHMEHLNSCQSGVLVVFGLLNFQFSVLLYS